MRTFIPSSKVKKWKRQLSQQRMMWHQSHRNGGCLFNGLFPLIVSCSRCLMKTKSLMKLSVQCSSVWKILWRKESSQVGTSTGRTCTELLRATWVEMLTWWTRTPNLLLLGWVAASCKLTVRIQSILRESNAHLKIASSRQPLTSGSSLRMSTRLLLMLVSVSVFLETKSIPSRLKLATLNFKHRSQRKPSKAIIGGVKDSILLHLNLSIQISSRWTEFTST